MGRQEFVPEPPLLQEKRIIYAFMVPIPDPDANVNLASIFFPIYDRTRPLASKKLDDKRQPIVATPSKT